MVSLSWPMSCSEFVHALEEERKEIEVFHRELPLCLQLVTQAIERVKEGMNEDDDSRDVLEEFTPLKPTSSSSSPVAKKKKSSPAGRNVQDSETAAAADLMEGRPKKLMAVKAKRTDGEGPFHFFGRDAAATTNSNTGGRGRGAAGGKEKEKQRQPHHRHKKARRNWSPALHCRFLQALEQLGGSHVAKPKQIRVLMKADGLTNDEVKSHLQKHRLQNRRQVVRIRVAPPAFGSSVCGGGRHLGSTVSRLLLSGVAGRRSAGSCS